MKLFSLLLLALPLTSFARMTTSFSEIIPVFSKVSFNGRSYWGAGKCTGTLIHPRLLLTAAHCVREFNGKMMNGHFYRMENMDGNPVPDLTAKPSEVYIPGKQGFWGREEIHPVRVHVSDAALPMENGKIELTYVDQDLAILEFDFDYPAKPRQVAVRTPTRGTPVEMVGFGPRANAYNGDSNFGTGLPAKHFGRNKLRDLEREMLVVLGSATVCENADAVAEGNWATCSGDSGGPLLDAKTGEILGVTSSSGTTKDDPEAGPGEWKVSIFVDLTTPRAVEFIRRVTENVGKGLPVPAPVKRGRRGD